MCGSNVRQAGHPRVLWVGEGGVELAGGLVSGVIDRLRVTVGVARICGTSHGLHQPVHGQYARVGGEHAVGGQAADCPQQGRGVGQPVQQRARDALGGVPGQDPQHLPGQRVIDQPIQGDVPDPGDGAGRVAAFGGGLVHRGRVAGQQVQVLPRGDADLGEVGADLLDGQRQVAQLGAQLGRPVRLPRPILGEDRGEQGLRFRRVQAHPGGPAPRWRASRCARRLVIRYLPAGARASSGAMSAGSVTLSRTTSHPGWAASHCTAPSRSASSGSTPDSVGCSATASAASPASISAEVAAVIHQVTT